MQIKGKARERANKHLSEIDDTLAPHNSGMEVSLGHCTNRTATVLRMKSYGDPCSL